ncbi:MAG: ISAzo13 family transposase [Campylobacterota bacterium]|nr:ISAzo13 family transposase [Campylobacterota bacterium]
MTITTNEINLTNTKYLAVRDCLSEKGRRIWAASEAKSYGWGGVKLVVLATGMSSATVHRGIKELDDPKLISTGSIRKKGGGRKPHKSTQKGLLESLDALVDPYSKGDPESPLRWTSKSTRKLAAALVAQGFVISHTTVGILLHDLGYTLQANKKTLENANHPDRDFQFQKINDCVIAAQQACQPTISVDSKKKENVGNYKNNGREYSEKGKPTEVKGHDFIDKKLGKVVPYGVYDIGGNKGWVSVGISADTAQFAVNTIRTWWLSSGCKTYPDATQLIITADCGGSNGYRTRLWKVELQKLANELSLEIHVHHFPPGTSKWNKIEHRLFSYISKNWRGKPLINRETVVNLIGNTTTNTGLTVSAILDKNNYKTGIKVPDDEMKKVNYFGDEFHPEWNYIIKPNSNKVF